ncbi:MAG: YggS family pyridoxal phosphate-dependent enzyme, partial [Clostridia bacterium]
MFEDIACNIQLINQQIQQSLALANRTDSVLFVAATKTQSAQTIDFLASNNLITAVGENRAQEIVEKYDTAPSLQWHMIGQLQSNKVKYIIDKVVLIHSLDRLSLAEEIDKQAKKIDKVVDCLIEINMGSELSKGGIQPQQLQQFCNQLECFDNIRLRGVMSVMPKLDDESQLIQLYRQFYQLYLNMRDCCSARHSIDFISCGMTND